jgi:hypothetical protein
MNKPVEICEPVYTFASIIPGDCTGCGIQYQPGDLVAKHRDEIRCHTCTKGWK